MYLNLRDQQLKIIMHTQTHMYIFVVPQSLSHVQLFATPWTVAHQAPLSMEFFRQEYWSGLSFPSPGDLRNPGIKHRSFALASGFFTTESLGKYYINLMKPQTKDLLILQIHTQKRKESKHNTKGSHQITKEMIERRKEQKRTTKQPRKQ